MATYLLLRNNKECGPFTLEQLTSMGLKPYDLVWVEGRSAAWRYPGEVEELKAFAPLTEEQPFDRFFKKPSGDKKEVGAEKKSPGQIPEIKVEQPQPSYSRQSEKIFVSLPCGTSEKKKPAEKKEQYREKYSSPKKETPVPITSPENELKTEYEQPLEAIKKMYTETLLKRREKISKRKFLSKTFQAMGAVAILAGLITLTYLTLVSGKDDPQAQVPASDIPLTTEKNILNEPGINEPYTQENNLAAINEGNVYAEPASNALPPGPVKKQDAKAQINKQETVQAKEDNAVLYNYEKTSVDPKTGERSKALRDGSDAALIPHTQKTGAETSITKMVSVTANDYKRRAFGGIQNLQLTVKNDSRFILDKVIVELQYLKPSEQPLKTDLVEFNSIAPNGSMTIRIPDYLRGIKVTYKIKEVESAQYDQHVAGL